MKIFGLFCAFLVIGLSIQGQSQEVIPSIVEVRAKYDSAVAGTTKPLEKFQDRYFAELAKLQDTAQKSGKLDLILEIREEAKTFRSGKVKPTTDPGLLKLRKIYSEEVARLAKTRQLEIAALQDTYQKQLLFIQTEQTKAGNVEAAIAARDEHKRISALAGGETTEEMPAENSVASAGEFTMEEKDERDSDEKLSEWLVGTVWKAGIKWKIKFLEGGEASKVSPDGEVSGGTFDIDEDKGHAFLEWDNGPPLTLEISKGGERLSDRSHSTTWVRLDHHLSALEKFSKKGPPKSKSDLERRLRGTTWSRNHRAKQPFLYEFDDDGNLFLSIWGQGWRNGVAYVVTDERHLTIGNEFNLEISEDLATWKGIDGGMTGILVSAE